MTRTVLKDPVVVIVACASRDVCASVQEFPLAWRRWWNHHGSCLDNEGVEV